MKIRHAIGWTLLLLLCGGIITIYVYAFGMKEVLLMVVKSAVVSALICIAFALIED